MRKRSATIPLIASAVFIIITGAIIFLSLKPAPPVTNFTECEERGYPIMESYPRRCADPDGKTFTEEVGVPKGLIVTSPEAGDELSGIVIVTGEAPGYWFFEAVFPMFIEDPSGNIVAWGYATATEDWMTENPVKFTGTVKVEEGYSGEAVLVLKKDNPSGLPENDDRVDIPVKIVPSPTAEEKSSVKVFFGRYSTDSSMDACTVVSSLTREVPKTSAVGKAALEELLKGPNAMEISDGYFTSMNEGVSLKSLTIRDGVAYADFDEALERSVGGSCRVLAIRTQIIETLKQFPSVKEVVISIDGRTEDILQP
jgi:hypothetical protein